MRPSLNVEEVQHTSVYLSKNEFNKHLPSILLTVTWQAFQGADSDAKQMHTALHLHLKHSVFRSVGV